MMFNKITTATLIVAALAPAAAMASQDNGLQGARELSKPKPARPTPKTGRMVVRHYLADYADGMDAKLIVGPCQPMGKQSIVCRARIVKNGRLIDRYRVTTTNYADASASLEAHVHKV